MIHFLISFCYVMAGAAAVFLLPQLGDWVRTDLAVVGAVIGVLAAANVHFYIAQSERVRRSQHGLEWLQARLAGVEEELTRLRRDVEATRADQAAVRGDAEQRIAQTVDEVRILQDMLERFIETRRSRDREARLRAMVAGRAKSAPDKTAPDKTAANTVAEMTQAGGERSTAMAGRKRPLSPAVEPRLFPSGPGGRRDSDRRL